MLGLCTASMSGKLDAPPKGTVRWTRSLDRRHSVVRPRRGRPCGRGLCLRGGAALHPLALVVDQPGRTVVRGAGKALPRAWGVTPVQSPLGRALQTTPNRARLPLEPRQQPIRSDRRATGCRTRRFCPRAGPDVLAVTGVGAGRFPGRMEGAGMSRKEDQRDRSAARCRPAKERRWTYTDWHPERMR